MHQVQFLKNRPLAQQPYQMKQLFLYVGLITDTTGFKSVPIFQMITESHTNATILKWLQNWTFLRLVPPSEVIVDDSSALISAVVAAFTNFNSTKEYLQISYAILQGLR